MTLTAPTVLRAHVLHALEGVMIVALVASPVLNQSLAPRGISQKLVTSGQEEPKRPVLVITKIVLMPVLLLTVVARLETAAARLETAAARLVVIHGLTSLLLVPTTTPAMEVRLSRMLRTASLGMDICT
jgi:hypothetical protein